MKIKIISSTVAKRKRIDSSLLVSGDKINLAKNSILPCESIEEGGANHWVIKFEDGKNKWFVYKPHCEAIFEHLITYHHFKACLPYARSQDRNLFFDPLNHAFREFHIDSIPRIAAFIAQVAHESGSLRWKQEIASGAAYEWRKDLGNVYRGDGRRYKGRGIIQLTGRSNYEWASKELGIDLINNPLRAVEPVISSRIACLYWQSRSLNKYADMNSRQGFRMITRKINGGYNGWMDRLRHWRIAREALHLSSI